MIKITTLALIIIFLNQYNIYADEAYLKNKDRISGEIVEDKEGEIVLRTESMGTVSIDKKFVERVVKDKETKVAKKGEKRSKPWQGEATLGYTKTSGNTNRSQLLTSLSINRKTDYNEFTIKGKSFYSSSDRKMDAQKYSGMVRYAFSFWEKKWYNFYKLEIGHDRFANVDYRLIPSSGAGYWFRDEKDHKLMTEFAIGFEHTNFRESKDDENETVLVPRGFFEKRLLGSLRLRQDLFMYLSAEDVEEFRIHSETMFINPIDDRLSLKLSIIDDYDSDPSKNTEKNDVRLITSLAYSF